MKCNEINDDCFALNKYGDCKLLTETYPVGQICRFYKSVTSLKAQELELKRRRYERKVHRR